MGRLLAVFVLLLASCHDGALEGAGTPCSIEEPCRAGFACVAGKCQPHDRTGAPCKHSLPFAKSLPLVTINADPEAFDGAAQLSPDEKQIHFTSSREGSFGIYWASRGSRFVDFSDVNSLFPPGPDLDINPSLTGDGQTIFTESSRGSGDSIIRFRRRISATAWLAPMELPALDHPASIADGHPYVLAKGDVLYFQSNREGRLQIFRTAEDTFGAWSKPALASGFSTDLAFSPVVTEDDMTMYFASDRGKAEEAAAAGGVPEPGDYDIWMAERPTSGEPFASPTRVEGINTTLGETPSWISPDACRLYFSRRIGNTDQSQIHMATR